MKRLVKLFIAINILNICLFANIIYSKADTTPKTIKEYRDYLASLKAKKAANESSKQKTQSEITAANNEISRSQNEIMVNQGKIDQAKKDIEKLNKEIEETEDSIKKTIQAYQLSDGQNVYLEYVFAAKTYEDLVYRYAIVEQIVDYNNEQIEEYYSLIEKNEKLQADLANREKELDSLIANLSQKIDDLGDDLTQYTEINVTIDDDIEYAQSQITRYTNLGCGETELLTDCLNKTGNEVIGDSRFKRPLTGGTITSYYGYRVHPITGIRQSFHSGVDIGGNSEGTNVYATANGKVGKIIRGSSCGGNQVYIYHTIGGVKYTSGYMHLLRINVNVGDTVTSDSVIGVVGGGSTASRNGGYDTCTTGPHLHFIIADGWYGGTGDNSYSSYSTFLAKTKNPKDILGLPDQGIWFSGR